MPRISPLAALLSSIGLSLARPASGRPEMPQHTFAAQRTNPTKNAARRAKRIAGARQYRKQLLAARRLAREEGVQ